MLQWATLVRLTTLLRLRLAILNSRCSRRPEWDTSQSTVFASQGYRRRLPLILRLEAEFDL
jgi:hypothetical protein